MGVVVDDTYAVGLTPVLEAPARTSEHSQGPGHAGRLDAELDARGPGAGGVEGHMVPRHGQHQLNRAAAPFLAGAAGGLTVGRRGEGQQCLSG